MLVSPAEPLHLKRLGRVSSVPETYGADFLLFSPHFGLVGVQRKELSDFVNSVYGEGDRFSREIVDMKQLDHGIWLLEGRESWNSDGQAMWTRTRYTRSQHLGLMFSLTFSGFSLLRTDTINETGELLSHLNRWLLKEQHTSLVRRGAARGVFGKPDTVEQQIFFAQGLPGLGYERARALVEHFGGLPLTLTGDLAQVPGIGKVTAKRIGEIFNGKNHQREE